MGRMGRFTPTSPEAAAVRDRGFEYVEAAEAARRIEAAGVEAAGGAEHRQAVDKLSTAERKWQSAINRLSDEEWEILQPL